MAPWPKAEFKLSYAELATMELALKLRQEANLSIEPLRKEGKVGSNLEIELTAKLKSQVEKQLLESYLSKRQLEQLVIISDLSLSDELSGNENLSVEINISNHTKCNRCWKRLPSVGSHADHPEICTECRDVVLQVS